MRQSTRWTVPHKPKNEFDDSFKGMMICVFSLVFFIAFSYFIALIA
ncbi:MAG: hypothetical protein AB8G05_25480 [Oligoflexales bacterium]